MQEQKKLILALVISCAILFGWQHFYAEPRAAAYKKQLELQQINAPVASLSALHKTSPATVDAATLEDRSQVIPRIERVMVKSGQLHGSISLKGARLDDLTLAQYKEHNTKDSPEVVLLSPSGSKQVFFAEFGWVASGTTAVPNAQTQWYTEDTELTPAKPVTLSWDNNAGLKFYLTIALDENFMFTVDRRVENYGTALEEVIPYGILNRSHINDHPSAYILHEGALGVFDNKLTEVTYQDLKEDKQFEYKNNKGWLGITDKYWLTAIIPDVQNSFTTNFTYALLNGQDRFQTDYLGQKTPVAPGENVTSTDHFFAGPKKLVLLENYANQLDIPLFDRAVDFGNLYFITKPLFKLLHYFNVLLGNFGLAILLLTVVIKLFMFPLANKSYVSMHQLKRLQPQLVELRERYTDKMEQNKAMMELYRKERVNPMSGCFPLLIQIPIFFALYKVLYVTIEMRHAPFYGWITDLSAPDPVTLLNLFGLLPYSLPPMLHIGIWPMLMTFTMFLQQRMSPAPSDPVQAKVMKALPFIFLFLFATFPAGLVIYWTWNNTLSILQQWVITRRLPK